MAQLSHFADDGASRMVNVGGKEISHRIAVAGGEVRMQPETLRLISDRKMAKGDVFEIARLAGIMGAKQTANLIPLCHPLGLDAVEVEFLLPEISQETSPKTEQGTEQIDDNKCAVVIRATASVQARTGVEMEALTAVSVAALTIYDMCKSVDRGMQIGQIRLLEKTGGRSGHYRAESLDNEKSDSEISENDVSENK